VSKPLLSSHGKLMYYFAFLTKGTGINNLCHSLMRDFMKLLFRLCSTYFIVHFLGFTIFCFIYVPSILFSPKCSTFHLILVS
jgi:hypothetical protein